MKTIFTINAKAKSAEILIYEDVGDSWLGGISAKNVVEELNDLKNMEEIDVRINSDGGSVFDGIAIYNALVRHTAQINVFIDGLAASISSVIAMAASPGRLHMAKNSWIMIHEPWTVAGGTADDLEHQAGLLRKIRSQLVGVYVDKTGLKTDEISDMVAAETWMESGEALEKGFADVITEDLAIAAHHNVAKYKHAPAILLNFKKKENKNSSQDAGVLVDMRERLKARKL